MIGGLVFLFDYAFDWNILDLSPSRFSSLFNDIFLPFIIFSSGFTMQKVFFLSFFSSFIPFQQFLFKGASTFFHVLTRF